jgi:hypothetical protein
MKISGRILLLLVEQLRPGDTVETDFPGLTADEQGELREMVSHYEILSPNAVTFEPRRIKLTRNGFRPKPKRPAVNELTVDLGSARYRVIETDEQRWRRQTAGMRRRLGKAP